MPTISRLASHLGLSDRQVRRHIAAGMPHDPALAAEWYRRRIRPPDRDEVDRVTGSRSLPTFLGDLVDVVRDAAYHFFPDGTSEAQVDALVGDILLFARDYAREHGCAETFPPIEREVRARYGLADAEKKAADKRAERRWHDRGGGPTIDLFEPEPPGQSPLAGLVWTEKGRRDIERYKK